METIEVLKAAKKIIGSKRRWCKEQLAVDSVGDQAPVLSGEAVSFCALGALHKACGVVALPYVFKPEQPPEFQAAIDLLEMSLPQAYVEMHGNKEMVDYNDYHSTSHGDVKDWFARAIKLAKDKK